MIMSAIELARQVLKHSDSKFLRGLAEQFLNMHDERSDAYLKSGGAKCPKCGEATIVSDDLDADGSTATANVHCETEGCGWEGVELWELLGLDNEETVPEDYT